MNVSFHTAEPLRAGLLSMIGTDDTGELSKTLLHRSDRLGELGVSGFTLPARKEVGPGLHMSLR